MPLAGLVIFALLAAGPAWSAQTVTVETLQAEGRLLVGAAVQPPGELVSGQKAALVLEVATDRWFSGGTRIDLPEVAGLVILQTEQFAANSSETRAGESWVIQRWTVDIYPQREGNSEIPPVALHLRVNHETVGEVAGTVYSPAVTMGARRPPGLEEGAHWVAAPRYEVEQHFDRELEGLVVGDAFEREIRFEAESVMAMMLPTFRAGDSPGLAAYPLPPQLDNSSNRGVTVARRVERVSYVVEAPGLYSLPAQDYFWWDTGSAELKLRSLPAVEFRVGGSAGDPVGAAQVARNIDLRYIALGLAALVLFSLALPLLRRLPQLPVERLLQPMRQLAALWHALRRPALPSALNPGSNAGD